MKSKSSAWIFSLAIISTASLSLGCSDNARIFVVGNVVLDGQRRSGEDFRYVYVTIGQPEQSFDENLELYQDLQIRMPDNTFKSIVELEVPDLEAGAISVKPIEKLTSSSDWPKGTTRIHVAPGMFVNAHGDRILSLEMHSVRQDAVTAPAIFRVRNTGKEYVMPLTHEQAVEIFGEPEKFREFYRS